MMQQKQKGFSLVELMIVVAIVGILSAIAIPSYQDSVRKSRRADATTKLTEIANLQLEYFIENRSYATVAQLGLSTTGCTSSNPAGAISDDGYYCITIDTTNGYVLTATPTSKGGQNNDSSCATISYNSNDTQGSSGGGTNCWGD